MIETPKITVDDIEVPEGMLEEVMDTSTRRHNESILDYTRRTLAEGLLWLAQNPIVPNDEESKLLHTVYTKADGGFTPSMTGVIAEWQRRMLLKREPELPNEVMALHVDSSWAIATNTPADLNKRITRAYELGKARGKAVGK